jgi:hypothetical protein
MRTTKWLVGLIATAIVLCCSPTKAQNITYEAIDQNQFNATTNGAFWTVYGQAWGYLTMETSSGGESKAMPYWTFGVPVPNYIPSGGGVVTYQDTDSFKPGIIPPASASVNFSDPISEIVIGAYSSQSPPYSMLINGISIVMNGATNAIPGVDTSSSQFGAMVIQFSKPVTDFSLLFNLQFAQGQANTYDSSDFWIVGVPEPSILSLVGIGFVGWVFFKKIRAHSPNQH